jgi:phosphatidylglycerol:prolipoprotein diacylglycerol transferase
MYPDLLSIGPLTLHTYGLFVALGLMVGLVVTMRVGKSQAMRPHQILDMGFMIILSAFIGSRAMYVFMNLSYYRQQPVEIFKVWEGGLVFFGGIVAVMMTLLWYSRLSRPSFWEVGDLWAPGVAVGQAIGRIGCLMAGCCYGKPTDVPWGILFTHPHSLAPRHVFIHPTQLYAFFSGMMIFWVLLGIHSRKRFPGQVFLWFLILHSTARLAMERLRGDPRGVVFETGMSITQLGTTLLLIASVIALLALKPKGKKDMGSPERAS